MTTAPAPANTVTEQLTRAGQSIEHGSFAIIDAEAGPHSYTADQWPIVRRMIHANADFEFNGLTEFHPRATEAGLQAILCGGAPIVANLSILKTRLIVSDYITTLSKIYIIIEEYISWSIPCITLIKVAN